MSYNDFVQKNGIIYHKYYSQNIKYTIKLSIKNENFGYKLFGEIFYRGGEFINFTNLILNNYKTENNFYPDIVSIVNSDYEELNGVRIFPILFKNDKKTEEFYQFLQKSIKIQCEFFFSSDIYTNDISIIDSKEIKSLKETIEKYFELINGNL